MEKERMAENEINIMDMIFVVKKNIFKIIALAVVMAVVFAVYTAVMVTPMYRSTTQLLIKGISEEAMSIYPDSTSRIMLVNNSIEVLSGTEVMNELIDKLNLKLTPEQLQSCIAVSSPADTQVLKISVTHPDPETAKDIALALSEESHTVLAETVGISALSTIQEAKTPTSPSSPNLIKNIILGGFLGGILAVAFYLLKWFINSKIYTPVDVEKVLGLTVFASVPLVESEKDESKDDGKNVKAKEGK